MAREAASGPDLIIALRKKRLDRTMRSEPEKEDRSLEDRVTELEERVSAIEEQLSKEKE